MFKFWQELATKYCDKALPSIEYKAGIKIKYMIKIWGELVIKYCEIAIPSIEYIAGIYSKI